MKVCHLRSLQTKRKIYFILIICLQAKGECNIIFSAYQQNMKVAYSVVLAGYKY